MSQEIVATEEMQSNKINIAELTPSQTQADLSFNEEVSTTQPLPAPSVPGILDYSSAWLSGEEANEAKEEMIKTTTGMVYGAVLYMLFINIPFGVAAVVVAVIAQTYAQSGNLEGARRGIRRSGILMAFGFLVSCLVILVIYIFYWR